MKISNPPIIEDPVVENQLVAMVSQDMTVCIMRLEKFIGLIAASKEAVTAIEEIVARKVDEDTFKKVQEIIDNRLNDLAGDIGDIDAGTKDGLLRLAIAVEGISENIKNLQNTFDKDITELRETTGKLDERVKALEEKDAGSGQKNTPQLLL